MSEIPVVPHVKELTCNKQKAAGGFKAYPKQHSDVREIRTRGNSSQWFIWIKWAQVSLKTGSKCYRDIV